MQSLVHLGILKTGYITIFFSHCADCQNSSLKRIISDFRFLNSRQQRVNLAFPLIWDVFVILESSRRECWSVLDLKDAYHIMKLSENSKLYCGILPHFVSAGYVYQAMSRRLREAKLYNNLIQVLFFSSIPGSLEYLAIMGNLLLHNSNMVIWNIYKIY